MTAVTVAPRHTAETPQVSRRTDAGSAVRKDTTTPRNRTGTPARTPEAGGSTTPPRGKGRAGRRRAAESKPTPTPVETGDGAAPTATAEQTAAPTAAAAVQEKEPDPVPADVVDRLLWRDAQRVLARHTAVDGGGQCRCCDAVWPCTAQRLATRAEEASKLPWRDGWTTRHDLNAMLVLPQWRAAVRPAPRPRPKSAGPTD